MRDIWKTGLLYAWYKRNLTPSIEKNAITRETSGKTGLLYACNKRNLKPSIEKNAITRETFGENGLLYQCEKQTVDFLHFEINKENENVLRDFR